MNTGIARFTRLAESKIAWGLLSVISALVIWMFVNSTELTTVSSVLSGVKVVFAGEEQLEALGYTITDVQNPEVTVRLSGPRSEIEKLTAGSITVRVTLPIDDITGPADMRLPAEIISYPSGVNSAKIEKLGISPNTVAFKIDNLITKEIPVKGEFAGTFADGFVQGGEITFSPDTVTIKGPEKLLNTVEYALVRLDQEGVSETLKVESAYTLVGKYNQPITENIDSITFESTTTATLPVAAVESIPLTVKIIPGGGADESDVKITITPASIELTGDKSRLDALTSLEIGSVDLASFALTKEWTFPLEIPAGLQSLTGEASVQVKAEIIGMDTKELTLPDVSFKNVPYGYAAQLIAPAPDITIRADSGTLSEITADDIRAVADLSDVTAAQLSAGRATVTVNISVSGYDNAGAVGAVQIQVQLTKT